LWSIARIALHHCINWNLVHSMESSIQKLAPRAGSPVMALCPEALTDFVPGTQNVAVTSARPFPEYGLVYLLSIFPAISHTFFLNEVRELRRQGFNYIPSRTCFAS
jgi:hypothetical protein